MKYKWSLPCFWFGHQHEYREHRKRIVFRQNSGFSLGHISPSQLKWFFPPSGDTQQCLETFLVITTAKYATGIQCVEDRYSAKHPTRHRKTSTHQKKLSKCQDCQDLETLVYSEGTGEVQYEIWYTYLKLKGETW